MSIFGRKAIRCRRSRLQCGGYAACEHVNPALIDQERYELTTESLEAVLEVQLNARMREADSPEKLALM